MYKRNNNKIRNKRDRLKKIRVVICGFAIMSILTGCYGPAQVVDEALGRERYPMTEEEAEKWLEENYTHDMTILERWESDTQVRFIVQDNDNGEKFLLYNNHDGFAGWTADAIYDEEEPEKTREYNEVPWIIE